MEIINFAAEANVSDIYFSVNIREIVNTFSYNCENMYMYYIMIFQKNFKEIKSFPTF